MIGLTVAHYRVQERLGGGGMGVVYRAQDLRLGRLVALKFLARSLAHDTSLLARFKREARTASALNHPGICTIHEIGEHEGETFIAMELIDGMTLQERIRAGPLPMDELLDLAIQLADALSAAHSKNVIHRDLKPSNIMLTSRGQAKILDFGLAKVAALPIGGSPDALTQSDEGLTNPGAALGTFSYMSPEQALGRQLDTRTDLFSLGVVLYEMATSRRAFGGPTVAVVLEALLNKRPVSALKLNAELAPELDPIIDKALEKDREVRYQAVDLRADLKRLQRDQRSASGARPVPLDQVPTAAQANHSWARGLPVGRRPLLSLLALVGAALAALIIVSWLMRTSPTTSPSPVGAAATQAAPSPATMAPPAMTPPKSGESAPAPGVVPNETASPEGLIRHQPIGCLLAGQFALLRAELDRGSAPPTEARLYFRSARGSAYYFVEMQQEATRLTARLPRPNLRAGSIDYYLEVKTKRRHLRTPPQSALVVERRADCPAGARIAEVGPHGAVYIRSAASPLIALRDALGLDVLVALLRDTEPGVRQDAADAIRSLMPSVQSAVDGVLVKLRHEEPSIRQRAAEDLAEGCRVMVGEAIGPLIGLLRDSSPAVRIKAAMALGETAPLVARSARALRSALQDPSPDVRRTATQALGSVGPVLGDAVTALDHAADGATDAELLRAIARARNRIEAEQPGH